MSILNPYTIGTDGKSPTRFFLKNSLTNETVRKETVDQYTKNSRCAGTKIHRNIAVFLCTMKRCAIPSPSTGQMRKTLSFYLPVLPILPAIIHLSSLWGMIHGDILDLLHVVYMQF
jgi:hypothetical protein